MLDDASHSGRGGRGGRDGLALRGVREPADHRLTSPRPKGEGWHARQSGCTTGRRPRRPGSCSTTPRPPAPPGRRKGARRVRPGRPSSSGSLAARRRGRRVRRRRGTFQHARPAPPRPDGSPERHTRSLGWKRGRVQRRHRPAARSRSPSQAPGPRALPLQKGVRIWGGGEWSSSPAPFARVAVEGRSWTRPGAGPDDPSERASRQRSAN